MRSLPFASHGAANEPAPLEPAGQSCGGSGAALGAALATALGVGAVEAAADATGALALAAAPPLLLLGLSHPMRGTNDARMTSELRTAVFMARNLLT